MSRTTALARRVRAALLAVSAGALVGCVGEGARSRLAQRVERAVAPLVAAHDFSGAIVLARRGEVVYEGGFGMANREAGVAFSPATPSDGGSLAKTFTAAAVQWLAHEGRIELDAPVVRYLPEFPHPETTVRHLISHTNGLPPYYEFFDPHFRPDELRTTEAMLGVVARELPRPAFPPGSRFEYSNFAFDLAALILERVSGQTYEELLRERFFVRLGMAESFARPGRLSDWSGARTLGYRWRGGSWETVDVFDMEAFLGASNLYFSARDLARWASANAAGTALPAAVRASGQRHTRIDGQPSSIDGLSWYTDDDGARGYYTGDINAFHGFVYWDRERDEAAAFVSNSSLSPWNLIGLQRELVAALAERPAAVEAEALEPFDVESSAAFAGVYEADGIGRVRLSQRDGGLRLRLGAGLTFDAFPVSGEVLYVPGPDIWMTFRGGRPPTAVRLRSMFLDAVARRVGDGGDRPAAE